MWDSNADLKYRPPPLLAPHYVKYFMHQIVKNRPFMPFYSAAFQSIAMNQWAKFIFSVCNILSPIYFCFIFFYRCLWSSLFVGQMLSFNNFIAQRKTFEQRFKQSSKKHCINCTSSLVGKVSGNLLKYTLTPKFGWNQFH